MKKEPALIVGALVAALNAPQLAALSMPAWAHTAIAVATIFLGAILTRSQVTPTAGEPEPDFPAIQVPSYTADGGTTPPAPPSKQTAQPPGPAPPAGPQTAAQ